MNRDELDSQIAVIGLSGRFPKSKDLDGWWCNLRDGVELISFFSEDELLALGIAPTLLHNPNYVRARATLDDVELFAASFFGFSPREAEITDPQQRIFLECAHQALENSGYSPDTFEGRIGVYAGQSISSYLLINLCSNRALIEAVGPYQVMLGSDKDFLTTLVSYKLNLKGPSMSVQTACSTSLVAVHLACQSLLNGECDMALAGGVCVKVPEKAGYLYQEGAIMSSDGHCRAFDAKGQGILDGNGAGIVVLKRLSEAVADGDNIMGVIKGSAINNDGSQKVGYTAPSIEGQSEVIAEALAMADVTADTISYVEAHGTGTPLGDPIEVAALTQAFRQTSTKRQYCAIGSVKTNLGHLDAAAGIAGLIKAVLQLQHKQLVPSLHYEEPNPKIDFVNSPFYVNTKLQEWKSEGGPRRAGVSSFGIGGTNAHVVLEEAPEREPSGGSRWLQLLTISAKTSTALEAATTNLEEHLKRNAEQKLADVAYTQAVGRTECKHRRALVCETREEALAALEGRAVQRTFQGVADGEPGVSFLFPGQGTQYVGMGRELYESEEVYRREVERCAEQLRGKLGVDLREVLYPQGGQDEKAREELKQTRLTQPALFAVEWGLSQLWRSWGVEPEGMAGHSVGEYVAATVAGVLELEEALEVVSERGRLMQEAEPGAMLSVPLEEGEVRRLVGEGLWIAAVNGPGLTVISGREECVRELQKELRNRGVEGRRLETSHAFHSGMMDGVLEEFRGVMQRAQLKAPQKRYLSNLSGTWIKEEEARDANYWVRHLRETVRFGDNVKELLGNGERVMLEVGPGNVLGGLARRQGAREVYGSLRAAQETGSDRERMVRSLGRLWVSGVKVDWAGYYRGEKRHRVVLPTYPFERQRYWVEAAGSKTALTTNPAAPLSKKTDVADWVYVPSWKRSAPRELYRSDTTTHKFLICSDECGVGSALAAHLTKNGHQVTTVTVGDRFSKVDASNYTISPDCADDYHKLLERLRQSDRLPNNIVHLWTVTSNNPRPSEEVQRRGFYSLVFLAQAIGDQAHRHDLQLDVVSNGLQEVSGEEESCPDKATVLGPCKVIPQEFSNIRCCSIDVLYPSPMESLIENLAAEVLSNSTDTVVAYRGRYRWVQTVESVRLEEKALGSARLRKRGVYLITGGVGGIGLVLAEHLAKTLQAKLVLTARTPLPLRENWDQWLTAHDEQDSTSGKIRKLRSFEQLGTECLVLAADVSNKVEMQNAIDEARRRFGAIHGVIHAAGIAGGGLTQVKTRETADRVLAPKLRGTAILASLLKDLPLDLFILCSSITSIRGAVGQVDYCAANCYLDAFARSRQLANCISINWDAWQEVGMAVDAKLPADLLERRKKELEATGIRPKEGVDAFDRIIRARLPQVIVSTQNLLPSSPESIAFDTAVEQTTLPLAEVTLHPRPMLQSNYAAPRNDIDVAIAEIWQRLLGIEQVGIYDNFFELGGHSLLATQVASRLRESLKVDLPLRTLFEVTTIADLSDKISSTQQVMSGPTDVGAILEELEQLSEEEAQQLLSTEVQTRATGENFST